MTRPRAVRTPAPAEPAQDPLAALPRSRRASFIRSRESDIKDLLLPAEDSPLPDLPGSIEAAILDVLEQVPGDGYAEDTRRPGTKSRK